MTEVPATAKHCQARAGILAAIVFFAAFGVFAFRLSEEPDFVDEWAYVSQAFYMDLLLQPEHPLWLEYPALDLPPLPKYLIGASLRLQGYRPPPSAKWADWYRDTHTKYGPPEMLTAARWPSVVMGALGCLAIFAIGTIAVNRRVGVLAALLLMLDPLYRMHARRAMSDVPAEALILATAAVGLLAWREILAGRWAPTRGVPAYILAGVLGGLAVLSKFNGVLGLFDLGVWLLLALALPAIRWDRRLVVLGGTLLTGIIALGTFTLLNPFLTANPRQGLSAPARIIAEKPIWERMALLVEHRLSVPREQQTIFPHNALLTVDAKLAAVAVQGFGRFGPLGQKRVDAEHPNGWFDSTRRYDREQDWGALIWLPLVLIGAARAFQRGRAQWKSAQPPTAWALLLQAMTALVVVTAFLPLAWDRFFLSIQPGSSLLAAVALVGAWDALRERFSATASEAA